MSRYVDLEGLTWDGTKITSKIQEVKTNHGYMQGITVGWLWGDNVPHIDLETYEEQIKAKVLDDFKEKLIETMPIDICDGYEAMEHIEKVYAQLKG